jgi:heme/copper-type cytochrome/quinol oxidase subunit 3
MTSPRKDYFGDTLTPAERKRRREAREAKQALENKRLGLLIFQLSWILAFVALIVVNWQLRFSYTTWPPPGVQAMGVALPTLATGLLLAAALLARRARKAVQAAALAAFIRQWGITLGLMVVFVGIMVWEWLRVETGTQYSSVFRLMTGFHSLHAVAVGMYMVSILLNAREARAVDSGQREDDAAVVRYGSDNFWAVEAASKMLDFVFIAWLLFYVVLYWWRS